MTTSNHELISSIFDGVQQVDEDLAKKLERLNEARATAGSVSTSEISAIKTELNALKTLTKVREYCKIGRNDPCPCGSGRKYKECCLQSGQYEILINNK